MSYKAASGSRYESPRETARNRSYRASSVFSNYSIRKRQKRETTRSSRKEKEKRAKREQTDLSASEKAEGDSDDDEELLYLRLKALKSKQEVKELIERENQDKPQVVPEPTEEESLRILALKSAVLKKKDFFKERKKQKMLENERPYSPSDALPELEMDMSLSPLGSPFNEINIDNEEVDMEISNDERESSDMDVAPSPQQVETVGEDEEIALRALLLTSIHKRKDRVVKSPEIKSPEGSSGTDQVLLAQSLKMVVQRLKQKKAREATPVVPVNSSKSGTKTIAMILAEQKGKKKRVSNERSEVKEKKLKLDVEPSEVAMIDREIEEPLMKPLEVLPEPLPELAEIQPASPQDSLFSTITDTKNIPLLPVAEKAKKSRLVTSLESVIKPVSRLIIPVRCDETDTDDDKKPPVKKTARKIIRAPAKPKLSAQPEFEKKVESFLKNIRKEQEKKSEARVEKPSLSSVKHLSKSAQLEYEKLLAKVAVLERAKEEALKAQELKRTKSNSEQLQAPAVQVRKPSPKKPVVTIVKKTTDKIAESLSMIPQLDEAAQMRFIDKTEQTYKNHR